MVTAARTFQQRWKAGRRVRENAAPHRRGSIRIVRGVGSNAVVLVNLDGRPPASFRPSQLTLL